MLIINYCVIYKLNGKVYGSRGCEMNGETQFQYGNISLIADFDHKDSDNFCNPLLIMLKKWRNFSDKIILGFLVR
jgi:hypothetical protein